MEDDTQDITHEIEVLTVHDEPEVRAVLRNLPPEAESVAQLLRWGGAVAPSVPGHQFRVSARSNVVPLWLARSRSWSRFRTLRGPSTCT